jgi:hypothetical protein
MNTQHEFEQPEYACDSCNKHFKLPAPRTRLGLSGRLTVLGMALARTLRHRHGLRAGYREIRPRLLAKRNDDAFQAFVGSFGLCSQCRGFVCSKCWNEKTRTCCACVAPVERRADSPLAARKAPVVARAVAKAVPKTAPEAWSRPTFGLALLMRPGRVRTATSVVLMVAALTLGAAEAAYVIAAPSAGPVVHAPATTAAPAVTLAP